MSPRTREPSKLLTMALQDTRTWEQLAARIIAEAGGVYSSSSTPPPVKVGDSVIAHANSLMLAQTVATKLVREDGTVGKDHPGKSCAQAHPGMSHDEYVIKMHGEEEEEEERAHVSSREQDATATGGFSRTTINVKDLKRTLAQEKARDAFQENPGVNAATRTFVRATSRQLRRTRR